MTPIPAGWKLVPIEPTPEMIKAWHDTYSKAVIKTGRSNRAYAAMLRAAPGSPATVAPGDAQDERQAFHAWFARRGVWPALCFEEVFIAGWNARPDDALAAGDALDAKRYRWLSEKAHQTAGRAPAAVLCDESDMFQRGEAGSESGFIHGKDLDDAIDAALAAQQGKGGE
ncbi:hypothetical protein [Achromobacter insolitus]|uniref:hypothetical protein n=1 Tax=Achromobacter insolitus TaxID=217204 RepID=UPI000CEB58B7|nr:hypothetical protein [Achromobacter insolitus]AVG38332.1 hypothetical protein MC81_02495 [Achromobacter insolitus]